MDVKDFVRRPVSLPDGFEILADTELEGKRRRPAHWQRSKMTGSKIAQSPYAFVATVWLLEMLMTDKSLNFSEIAKRLNKVYAFSVSGETVQAFWNTFVLPMIPDERLRATQAAMALSAIKGKLYNASAAYGTVAGIMEEIRRLDAEYENLMQIEMSPSRAQAVARITSEKARLHALLYDQMGVEEWNARINVVFERISAVVVPLLQQYVPEERRKEVLSALKKKFSQIFEEVQF